MAVLCRFPRPIDDMQDEFQTQTTAQGFLVEGGERRPVTLHLGPLGVKTDDDVRVRWREAKVKRDEADGALLIIGRSATVGSTDPGFLREVEGTAGNDIDQQLARLEGLPTSWWGSQWVGCLVFFGLIAFGVMRAPGCYRGAVDQTVASMPFEFDESLGEQAQDSMDVGEAVEDEVLVDAIQRMVDRLSEHFEGTDVSAEKVEWQVRIVRSEQINAFALPGGYITVFTGLMEKAETPDMVAGVIAHEMAHVLQRHGLKRVANQIGLFAGVRLVLGDTGGILGAAGEVFTLASANQYGQSNETEADVLGTQAMVRAGLDPRALAEFFLLLKEEYGDVPAGLAWMSTHPGHTTRAEAIESIVADMEVPPSKPLGLDWDSIQERLDAGFVDEEQ